jgi:hypothetical protein
LPTLFGIVVVFFLVVVLCIIIILFAVYVGVPLFPLALLLVLLGEPFPSFECRRHVLIHPQVSRRSHVVRSSCKGGFPSAVPEVGGFGSG